MLRKYILTFINFSSQIYWPSTIDIQNFLWYKYVFVKYILTLLELKEIGVAVIDLSPILRDV